jgi:hypothetical protein
MAYTGNFEFGSKFKTFLLLRPFAQALTCSISTNYSRKGVVFHARVGQNSKLNYHTPKDTPVESFLVKELFSWLEISFIVFLGINLLLKVLSE